MAQSIVAGSVKDIILNVRTATDRLPKTTGTVYCLIRLEDQNPGGDGADHAKFFDANDNTWQTNGTVTTWPTMSHLGAGQWLYQLPAGATTGLQGGSVFATATDNETTPTSEATLVQPKEWTIVAAIDPGLREVTLHVQDSSSNALVGARVVVKNSANDAVITKGESDASGDFVTALDDGTYTVAVTKAGYTFASATVTVTATQTTNISAS